MKICSRILLSGILLSPLTTFGGFTFSAVADATNTTGDGFGVGVTGFIDYNYNAGAPQLEVTVHNTINGAQGYALGMGLALAPGFSLTGTSGLVSDDLNFPGTFATTLAGKGDTNVEFTYTPHNNVKLSNDFNAYAEIVGTSQANDKEKGINPDKAIRFLLPISGAGSATAIADILNFDKQYQLGFRFQSVEGIGNFDSNGSSTKLHVTISQLSVPVPEPSALIMLVTGLMGAFLIARRR